MTESSNLRRLFRGLEALYGADSGIDPGAHLLPYRPAHDGSRELVLFRESEDGALELGLALEPELLEHFEDLPAEKVLGDEDLGDTLPVLEGLSHLLYLAESARRERPISGLELETQAEVDKLALCVLHRWPSARDDFAALVDRLYYRFSLVPDMSEELETRYRTANRVALAFSRRLRAHVDTGRIADLRRALREFWQGSMQQKLRLAG